MATLLTEETGEGVHNSNSYVNIPDFVSYFAERQIEAVYTNSLILIALVEASSYINIRWAKRFRGTILTSQQGLDFPRKGLHVDGRVITGVPAEIKTASILYAMESLKGALYNTTSAEKQNSVTSKTTKVGPISTSLSYDTSVKTEYLTIDQADALCRKFTHPRSSVVRG